MTDEQGRAWADAGRDAVEVIAGDPGAPVVLSCEHASNRLPAPWRWPLEDAWIVETHWAFDLGARLLTHEIARALGAPAVLSRFSRLLVDPNRAEEDPSAFRTVAEGRPVALNAGLSAEERERRLARLHRPYHAALDAAVGGSRAPVLFSVHSFTPEYEGTVRDVELGVLFDEEELLAEEVAAALATTDLCVRMNEPYSGRAGLIYSAGRHAKTYRRRAIELEVRQDHAVDAAVRRRIVDALLPALREAR